MNSNNKEKRPRDSSGSNKSFVKNVTSRMSGLLPSTITKWFSSPSSSNANGSATVVDATDSSTEDEAPDIQPPTKRLRISPSATNNFRAVHTKTSSTNTESTDFMPTPVINSPSKCMYYKRDTNFISTPFNAKSDESTNKTESESRVSYILKNSLSSGDTFTAKSRKSLFNTFTNEKPSRNEDKSCSDMTKDVNRSYNKSSLLGSPFYPGRTTYGGAANSSYSKNSYIHKNKNTVVNQTKSSESLHVSHSARRIMDLLENYSSPLAEARRISQYVNPDTSMNTTVSAPDCKKVVSYKTQELHVPSVASILSIKRKSRLMDTTSAARQLIASHSSSANVSPYPVTSKSVPRETDTSAKFVTKIKNTLRKSKAEEVKSLKGFVAPPPLDLPTAVLQIDKDNLPKFSFENSASKSLITTDSSSLKTQSIRNISEPANVNIQSSVGGIAEKRKSLPISSNYTFSNPVKVSNDSITSNKLPMYTFLSPEKTVDINKVADIKNDSVSSIVDTTQQNDTGSTNAPKWKCNDCWVSNMPDVNTCVCCGGKKPAVETKNCVVCKIMKCAEGLDVCSDCKKNQVNNLSKSDSSKWKCGDCWVSNDSNEEKCVCCGGKKPNKQSEPNKKLPASTINTPTAETAKWKCADCWVSNDANVDKCVCCGGKKPGNKSEISKPEPIDKGWKCNVCLLENKSNAVKCIACLTSKPGSSPTKASQNSSSTNFKSGSNDLLKNIVKSQAQKWECPYCLVHNDNDKSKCVCCDSEKPGAPKKAETKFNFGISPSNTFKFGIDPKISTEKEKVDEKKSEVKETNNNELPKVSFSFGIPTTKANNAVSDDKEKQIKTTPAPAAAPTSSIPTFSFGIPKDLQNKSTLSNEVITKKTIELPSKSDTEKNENVQEVPNIDNNERPKAKLQFSSNLFKSPALPSVPILPSTTASNTISLNTSSSLGENKASSDLKSINIPASGAASLTNFFKSPTSTTVESTSASVKAIDTSSISSNKTLFQNSEPSKTSINFTAPPLFQKSVLQQPTTASPLFPKIDQSSNSNTAISPFQKNDLPASTSALFQKPESTVTTSMSLFSTATPPISSTPSLFQKNEPTTTAQTAGSAAPLFSFGLNAQSAPTVEKPKFNFSFGNNKVGENMFATPNSNNSSAPAFGGIGDISNKFGAPASTTGGITSGLPANPGGNGLASGTILGGNGLGTLGSSNMSPQSMNTRNRLQSSVQLPTASSGLFGAPTQKESSTWPSSNTPATNIFSTTAPTNAVQKPATVSFGSNYGSFNMGNNNSVPVFGANTQTSQNVFGMASPSTNNAPSMFSSPTQNQSTPSMFGNTQPASNPVPTIGIFGQQNAGPTFGSNTPTFGSNTSTFEAPQNPTPAPAFNFGSASQPSGVFGFGQQTPQQPQQGGVYSFGSAAPAAPQVQFSVGSAPATVRRMRKARRTTQR